MTISAILAAVLWCFACSFYSTAISHCTSVGIKWEKGGVSPSELIRQQTYARQDGAGNQPEVTLWQTYPEQEIMASDKKKIKADIVAAFGDCGDIVSSMMAAGAYPARSDASGYCRQYRFGILPVGQYQCDWVAGKGGRKAVLCPRHI